MKEIEKRTNGRVKISHFTGATLSPMTQTYDSLMRGLFEMGSGPFSYNPGRFPFMEILDLPLGYRDAKQSTFLANDFYKKFKPKELKDVKVLFLHCGGPGLINTKNKISSLEEVKGLRIKSTGISSKIVEALGGTPVTMPITETYDALKKGLADGLLLNIQVLKTYKFGDLLKYTVQDYGMSNCVSFWVAMNKQKWDSLPKDIQQIIEKVTEQFVPEFAQTQFDLDKEGEEYAAKAGHQMVRVSKAEQAKTAAKMKPLFDAYLQDTKKKGLPGDEAFKFCVEYLKIH
jgi:TRAP-type C4-dicarboxylate transport system substrate-binding protein